MIALAAATALAACALPSGAGDSLSANFDAYSRRSVQIVALAASDQNGRLSSMISPTAEFGLGSGDVGNPLWKGLWGATALSSAMNAQTFQYNGWDGIPGPSDACGDVHVEVTFVSSNLEREANVKFDYHKGVLISAMGWWRSRNVGIVKVDAR